MNRFIQHTLQVARAEIRAARRLLRFRVLAVLLALLSLAAYGLSCAIQSYIAPFSPSFIGATPLYLLGNIDPTFFLIFQVAVLLVVFDVDQRNARYRIAEVLESRPVRNIEVLAGRVLAYSGLFWGVVAAIVLVMQSFGLLAQWTRFEIGGSLQLHSILNLLLLDAPVTLLVWCSYVVLLDSIFKRRVITLALGLVGMFSWYFLVLVTPFAFLDLVSPSSNATLFVSDILPELPSFVSITLRIGTLALAAALTAIAVCVHGRTDSSSRMSVAIVAAALFLVVLASISQAGSSVLLRTNEIASWREAHQLNESEGVVEVQKLWGNVQIDPGKMLKIDLNLDFVLDDIQTPPHLIFTFNPGMRILRIELNGIASGFSFADGILELLPKQLLEPNVAHTFRIIAVGVPNPRFSYLDAPFDYMHDPDWSLEVTRSFGSDVSIFEERYLALMPGSYWYPIPGLVNDRYGKQHGKKNFFELDLAVEIENSSWLLAGTGVHRTSDTNLNRYEVKPTAPVSEFGLFASKFVKVEKEIENVTFSVFFHALHSKNLHIPELVSAELEVELVEALRKLAGYGLDLPHQSISIIEVPNRLRTVGGGWRMKSLNALPGAILLKERGYPVARIDLALKRQPDPRLKYRQFKQFFENGIGTDNLFYTIHKHYWSHATSASGCQSKLLDHFTQSLLSSYMPIQYRARSFSVYAAIPFLRMAIVHPLYAFNLNAADRSIYSSRLQFQEYEYARRDSVLTRMEKNSLLDLPSKQGHQKDLELMLLKIEQIADAFRLYEPDADKALAWLASLREKFSGSTYQYDDLIEIARDQEITVHPFLTDWLTASTLPGFISSEASIARLSDSDDGFMRHETRFAVRNTQPVEGFVSLSHLNESTPIHIAGESTRDISFISENPPFLDITRRFEVHTGLSLNREGLHVPLDVTNMTWNQDAMPGDLSSESDWKPEHVGLVVDDLDEGFSVVQPKIFLQNERVIGPVRWFLLPLPDIELDGQLPSLSTAYVMPQGWWRRTSEQNAYGLYRGTLAMTHVGSGSRSKLARFAVEVPQDGQWSLEFFVHEASSWFGYGQLASFRLVVSNGTEKWNAEVDPETSLSEWRLVGNYDLKAGTVNVDVVGATKRSVVYADAIRWTQLAEEEQSVPMPTSTHDLVN